ncbi:MAG: hypothetical protein MUC88_00160 [Planctomycetes bacterium]|nr:hypothetical protein [Planctomycetota bacterium]
MIIERTPVAEHVPPALLRNQPHDRTPILGGIRALPLSELIFSADVSSDQVESSLKLAEVAPEDDRIWNVAQRELLSTSLAYFFSEVITAPQEPPYNGKSLVGRHHEEWDELVTTHDRVLVEAARDHGKSHFFSLAYPIWMGGYRKPKSLGYIFSSTQDTANALLALVKEELLTNPKLRHLVPVTEDRLWSKKEITLRNGTIIRARGMGVKIRGGHPSWIVVDDCLTDEDIYSETIRRRNIDYFLSAISNMVTPGGQIVVVGTPMHYADLYGHIEGTGRYTVRKYPAIDKFGRVLFPERYNRDRLEAKRQELGPARFAREFLCQPLSDEASLFPSKLFEGGDVRLPYILGLPGGYWRERGCMIYTGIDFAMSASSSADWTVIFTTAVDEQRNRWLVDCRRGRGWGFQKQLDEIKEVYVIYGFEVAHAESNQFQRIFTDELRRDTDIPIRKFFTSGVQPKQPWRKGMTSLTMGKHNLDRGVPSLRMTLENRKWRWPRGDQRSIEVTDIIMGELMAMSWQNGQVVSVGEHDDCVMAMWMADTAIRAGGFQFSFGDAQQAQINALPQEVAALPGPARAALPAHVVQPPANTVAPLDPPEYRQEHDTPARCDPSLDERSPTAADLGFGYGIGGGF